MSVVVEIGTGRVIGQVLATADDGTLKCLGRNGEFRIEPNDPRYVLRHIGDN